MGLRQKLQARMELNRLEDRYVSRKNRNVWRSDAQYVDGDYIYGCREHVEPPPSRTSKTAKPSSSGSSSSRSSSRSDRTSSSRGSNKSSSSSKWSMSSGWSSKVPTLRLPGSRY